MWFTIAVVAAAAGVVLLAADRSRRTAGNRERQRWAALRGWTFIDTEPALPEQWSYGAIGAVGSPAEAVGLDVVTGSIFTADGRRQVHVFDLDHGGRVAVIAAVRRRHETDTVVEFRLPSVAAPDEEAGLDLLGPVGDRFAFVEDLAAARPMITPDLVDACDELGEDIGMVWLEGTWVLAAAPPHAAPQRIERLIRDLGELADLVDPVLPVPVPRPDAPYDVEEDGGVAHGAGDGAADGRRARTPDDGTDG